MSELPHSVSMENYMQLKSQIGNWVEANQALVVNDSPQLGSGSGKELVNTYMWKLDNKLIFDNFFNSALVILFKKSFFNCTECRTECPKVLNKLSDDYGPALRGVGFDPSDEIENIARCSVELCPSAFGKIVCNKWHFQDSERRVALYAAGATAFIMLVFACILACLFSGSGKTTPHTQTTS